MQENEKITNVNIQEVGSDRMEVNEENYARPPIRSFPDSSTRPTLNTDDWWAWELVGVIFSAGAIAAIVGLLAHLQDRPQPQWMLRSPRKLVDRYDIPDKGVTISLNSVVSWISTVGKICVLIPVTKGLGQLKWVWFAEQERELTDFERFENATRGLTGSAFLVWRLKGRHFAVVGAVAVILALGFDPFIQNLVKYNTKYAPDPTGNGYMASSRKFKPDTSAQRLDMFTKWKIDSAIYDFDSNWRTPSYLCYSGNCTWSEFQTLAVCSRCADLTSKLQKNCSKVTVPTDIDDGYVDVCDYSIPSGLSLSNENAGSNGHTVMNMVVNYDPVVFTNYTYKIGVVQSIASFDSTFINSSAKVSATECVFIPCVKTLSASVGHYWFDQQNPDNPLPYPANLDGFNEIVSDTYEAFKDASTSDTPDPDNDYISASPPPPKNDLYPDNSPFLMNTAFTGTVSTYLTDILNGNAICSSDNTCFFASNCNDETCTESGIIQAIYNSTLAEDPCFGDGNGVHSGSKNVECTMANIAQAITVAIRNNDFNQIGSHYYPGMAHAATGDEINAFTYVHVTFYWIALPIVVWFLSVTMLLGTAWKTKKAGIRTWRTSPLALVFLGLGEEAAKKAKSMILQAKDLLKLQLLLKCV